MSTILIAKTIGMVGALPISMRNYKTIIKQLQKIKTVSIKNMDKNPAHFSMVALAADETLAEIQQLQLQEIEALELSLEYQYA